MRYFFEHRESYLTRSALLEKYEIHSKKICYFFDFRPIFSYCAYVGEIRENKKWIAKTQYIKNTCEPEFLNLNTIVRMPILWLQAPA